MDVIAITAGMTGAANGGSQTVDYAVKMKRVDNSREMHRLLEQKQVNEKHAESLARVIAAFHQKVEIIHEPFDTSAFHDMYADLQSIEAFTREYAGEKYADIINQSIAKSGAFLDKHAKTLENRVKQGFIRDCHGDLNVYNIFLYDEPLVFDCLEFNEDFRYIDILNEVAFLRVDLDFFDMPELGDLFIRKYGEYSGLMEAPETDILLSYYKSYRANIRAKVTLISARDNQHGDNSRQIGDACRYLDLMDRYIREAGGETKKPYRGIA
jgi:aminoglycoside phosphotransferase family enzyme